MKFLSFDVESNGLHGPAFSVAAILITQNNTIESEFVARCPIEGPVDPWVAENVLPPMHDIPETHKTAKSMRDAFWEWYLAEKPRADFVLANNPYPVEARFLLACQDDDPGHRYTDHPFPLIDLASLLLEAGIKTREERKTYVNKIIGITKDQSHNPKWDALITAKAAFEALSHQ